jgi:formylglycine-generating enzyme
MMKPIKITLIVLLGLLAGIAPARAIDGTFNVTETWSATLTYSGWGDQNFSGTRQFSGSQSAAIVVANGNFELIDRTSIAHEPPAGGGRSRTLNFSGGQFTISGGRVMPYILGGQTLSGVIYLGQFAVTIPLVDGQIPTFHNFTAFSSSGASLSSLSGSGSMTGPSLSVSVTSTSTWTPATGPPIIITHPVSRTISAGGNTSFSVAAIGAPTPAYQWERIPAGGRGWMVLTNDATYSNVTAARLNVTGVSPAMNGDQFRCLVSNSSGWVGSAAATLTVFAPPVILTHPQSYTVDVGATVQFDVETSGATPLQYQWRFEGEPIIGETSASLTLLNVRADQAGTYSVRVTNSLGQATSNPAALTVRGPSSEPPVLTITREGASSVRLSWAATAAGFSLQSKTSASGGDWHMISGQAAEDEGEFRVLVPLRNQGQFFRLATDSGINSSMALIPAGPFEMGDSFNEGHSNERPVHTVYVSAFSMGRTEVTKEWWDEVRTWGVNNGYTDLPVGGGKAANHPVHTVNWYDVVKWCNARSEKEGRIPAYYTSAAQTTIYKTGQVDVQNEWVKWDAGYRLPTEAEWEKAARGGSSGRRFPWGDTITHSQANYSSSSSFSYDISPTRGDHPTYATGNIPFTSPVGSFAPNAYGLYDMAGNAWEWCWDWWTNTDYSSSPGSDPRGPATGSVRVNRGGSWRDDAFRCRAAIRTGLGNPGDRYSHLGFRSVLPPGQP